MAPISVVGNGGTGKRGIETVSAVNAADGLHVAGSLYHREGRPVIYRPGDVRFFPPFGPSAQLK